MHPILFHEGPITVRSFGVMMALAFVAAGIVAWWQLKRRGENPELVFNLLIGAIVGGVVGAKLHYLILHPDQFRVAAFNGGGLVWYGGLFGGAAGVALAAWLSKLRFSVTADVVAPALAMGYAVGRIGCFLNGDDYGKQTNLPWAMSFPKGEPPTAALVHPTQLYESLLSLGIFFLLIYVFSPRMRRSGQLFAVWMVLAGIERFLVEFVRTNKADLLGLTQQQWISIGLILVGAGVFWWLQRRPDPGRQVKGQPAQSGSRGGGPRQTPGTKGRKAHG
jgi:phosphatidylglycerol:prolipoprotein diacylglycerol transferase